ncbi:MAG TPA: response regulator [Thermoanaerobaculia bacterium]|nr:response regulator [Thermoanaerobaculia bacterium]
MPPPAPIPVLLVEDSASDAQRVREALAGLEAQIALAHVETLAAALERLRREPAEVVLLDLGLPDSDGFATLEALQAAAPEVAVVVLTGLADESSAVAVLQRGAQDYLPKRECTARVLQRVIRYTCERRRAESALLARQMQLEEQLREAQKMEAVGRLAGGVAHDFNNLLTAILGYTSLLAARFAADETACRELHEVQKAGERAATLTRQLLAFSRRQVLQPQTLDLREVVAEAAKRLGRLLGEGVELEIAARLPVKAKADRGQLEQVLVDLAQNARDAMPAGGTLRIEIAEIDLAAAGAAERPAVKPGRYALLSVSDTGAGMDGEVLSHLFEPFFTTKGVGQGTGLGLATVYGIVRQSGGHVTVESAPGRGTTFRIYLPLVEEPGAAAAAPPQTAEEFETILLVDDEPSVRRLARLVLEKRGYRVLEAESAAAAMDLAGAHSGRLDLVLTDAVMPGLSGRSLLAHMASARPEARGVLMSGYSAEEVTESDRGQRPPFLQKPFAAADLLRKVREVLDAPPAAAAAGAAS